MNCNQCGKEIPQGSKFCSYCGVSQMQRSWTLGEIYQKWSSRKFHKLSVKCRKGYETAWRHLAPLADTAASLIDLEDLQGIMDEMLPTSQSNQQKLQCLISQLCKQSFLLGNGLRINFAEYLETGGYQSKETLIFEDDEILKLYQYAKDKTNCYWQAARVTVCLILLGLRPNELFKIRKEDINVQGQYMIIEGSKTAAGKGRLIPILGLIWPFVAEWYLSAKPSTKEKSGFLLTGAKGGQYLLQNWRKREFYPLMLELTINQPNFYGVRRRTPYSCRHTFASLAYRAGVEKEILKKIIGHTTWEFTAKTYVHAQIEQYKCEAAKIQTLLQEISHPKEETVWF